MKKLLFVLGSAVSLVAQTGLPTQCSLGVLRMETAGPNIGDIYKCYPTNTWVLLSSGGGGGGGSVTSVGWTGGIVSVGSPTTTPAFTVAGTSGGIPYFSSASTWASSAALGANLPVIGGGAGVAPSTGTRSGNTTKFGTTGTPSSGKCVEWDSSGNLVTAASNAACGSGGGGTYVGGLTGTIVISGSNVDVDLAVVPGLANANTFTGLQTVANLVRTTPVAFSALPSCASGTEGAMRAVTDSSTATWGATITGSSTNHVLAFCNGTNWTVAAK